MRYEPNQINVRDSFKPVFDPLGAPLTDGRVLMNHPTRTYIDPPDSLRQADEALIRLRATLQALGLAYLLGDRQAIMRGLSTAIGHTENILYSLKNAKARSTRT